MKLTLVTGAFAFAALIAASSCSRKPEGGASPPPRVDSTAISPQNKAPPLPASGDASSASQGWLRTEGNRILLSDGRPFLGRGANVHDTRGCNACAYEPPHPEEVTRRIDVLVDQWHANLIRLDMESYDHAEGRVHWKSPLDDDDYVDDLKTIVDHVGTKKGVYILLSLWKDPSQTPMGLPSAQTVRVWEKLAKVFKDSPQVLFGLTNEPEKNSDGSYDSNVWHAMNDAVSAIRRVEGTGPHHLVSVQGTRDWARVLDYYESHPITAGGGGNIVYETHVYDSPDKFPARFIDPSKKLPVIIGEFGPVTDVAQMSLDDCAKLMDAAEKAGVPYIAYTFHFRCPPNLLIDDSNNGCGVGSKLDPSPWGKLLKDRLSQPWAQ